MIDWLPEYFTTEKVAEVNGTFDAEVAKSTKSRAILRENLVAFSDLLDEFCIRHLLVFGTLLGAVREKDLIEGDHDVDIALHPEDRWAFAALVGNHAQGLSERGWKPIRLWNDLVSFIRNGEYIDIYFFGPQENSVRLRCLDYTVTCEEFESPSEIEFLGKKFLTVKDPERYLVEKYGSNWRTPASVCATT